VQQLFCKIFTPLGVIVLDSSARATPGPHPMGGGQLPDSVGSQLNKPKTNQLSIWKNGIVQDSVKVEHAEVRLIHLAVLRYYVESDSFRWAMVSSTFCSFLYASANGVGVCFTFLVVVLDRKEFSVCCCNDAFANHSYSLLVLRE
jgi:hypothetical protein